MKDMTFDRGAVQLLAPADITNTDTQSQLLDLSGFEGAGIIVNVGALTGHAAGATTALIVEESDSTAANSFTPVAPADLVGSLPILDNAAADDNQLYSVGYRGTKRYIRVNIDHTEATPGTITSTVIGVTGVLGFPRHMPVSLPDPITAT
jgi:hypothetical protein